MDTLNSQKKELLKQRLLQKIESIPQKDLKLSTALINLSKTFELDAVQKARLKEGILTQCETLMPRSYFWEKLLFFNKKFVSAMLLMVLSMGFVSVLTVDVQIVRAESFTVLDNFVGDVSVQRGGEKISVEKGMELYEKDVISTGANGWISIEYLDNSVTRLASNTEVVLRKLLKSGDARSYVSVMVNRGQMWSKVVNLVDESYFSVQSSELSAQSKKAAFNVDVASDQIELEVFSHAVELDDGTEVESGSKAIFDHNDVKVEKISDEDKKIGWVQSNMESDKTYVAKVGKNIENSKKESVGDGALKNSLREDALLLITFDDVKKEQLELDLLEKKMISAELTLSSENASKEDLKKAREVVDQFSNDMRDFYTLVDTIESRDSNYANELRSFVDTKLEQRQKDLGVVGPEDVLYEVKESIDQLALGRIKNVDERAELEYKQVKEKLFDADDSIASGNDSEQSREIIKKYEGEIDELALRTGKTVESDLEEEKVEPPVKKNVISTPAQEETTGSYGVKFIEDKPLPAGL